MLRRGWHMQHQGAWMGKHSTKFRVRGVLMHLHRLHASPSRHAGRSSASQPALPPAPAGRVELSSAGGPHTQHRATASPWQHGSASTPHHLSPCTVAPAFAIDSLRRAWHSTAQHKQVQIVLGVCQAAIRSHHRMSVSHTRPGGQLHAESATYALDLIHMQSAVWVGIQVSSELYPFSHQTSLTGLGLTHIPDALAERDIGRQYGNSSGNVPGPPLWFSRAHSGFKPPCHPATGPTWASS